MELTLEVMSSFELDQMITSLSHHETISFQIFIVEYLMSYVEFSVAMGLLTWSTLAQDHTPSSTLTCRST